MNLLPTAFFALAAAVAGCGSVQSQKVLAPTPADIAAANVVDARARFRTVFCAAARRDGVESAGECSAWLQRFPDEPAASTAAASTANVPALDLLVVPGIFGECVQNIVTVFGDAMTHLGGKGWWSTTIPVRGRASSEHNAAIIRDHVLRMAQVRPGRRFLLLSYSKGTSDSLVALDAYPEIRSMVAGLVSFAGVVGGSVLADSLESFYGDTVAKLPYAACPVEDEGEVRSLSQAERRAWLAEHKLPDKLVFFSVVALPSSGRMSAILAPLQARVDKTDRRNDSQVIYNDALIPGSTLLGYANADHWAIALPFESQAPVLAATLVNKNRFPRAQLVEAAVVMAEEAVARQR